ncbi:MAG: hypothetical protein QM499_09345 [Flavobacteriaceae bacterium]
MIALLLFLPFYGFVVAQTQTNLKSNSRDSIKVKAEEWFKQTYVESSFKDPYSYRLMGIKVIPLTYKQGFEKQLISVLNSMKECKIHPDERNQKSYEEYIALSEETTDLSKKEQKYIDKGKNVEYHTKKKAKLIEYTVLTIKRAESIARYLLDVKEKERIEGMINILTEEQSTSIAYYDIRLDCYSKNDLGNEVLGRYSFPFTDKGPLYGDSTIKYIVNLND